MATVVDDMYKPRYCENDLYIAGEPEEVNKVLEFMRSDHNEFDFEHIVPYPEELRERDEAENASINDPEKYKAYEKKYARFEEKEDWCLRHWGTLWNAIDVVRRDRQGVCVSFKTARLPPTRIIMALGKRFHKVRFILEYFKAHDCLCGGMRCNEAKDVAPGKLTNEWSSPYHGHRGK